MKRKTQIAQPVQNKIKLDSFMFYTVLSLAALAAITSYSSGASIEASFIRAVVVLLICTILGYALNIAMDLSARNQMMTTVLDAQGSEINMGATRGAQASPEKPARGRMAPAAPVAQAVAEAGPDSPVEEIAETSEIAEEE